MNTKENNTATTNNNTAVTAESVVKMAVAELLAKAGESVRAEVEKHPEWDDAKKLAYLTKSATKVELPEVTACLESEMPEERAITDQSVTGALEREKNTTNTIRNGEILIAEECEGNLSAFKKALKDGLVIRPEGLEAVSFHCAGFAKRDEGLVARQFNVTIKVNGKWQPLSRYAASGKGGHFAMGATQTLKGAKTLAAMLKAVWINGQDLKPKGKKIVK